MSLHSHLQNFCRSPKILIFKETHKKTTNDGLARSTVSFAVQQQALNQYASVAMPILEQMASKSS